ncbi:MAG TPA: GMC oxidoreductase, partial [Polyangiaceae bacterium]|nr:GMC oxidoreductase [Polyangiaceae bacterium]
VFGYKNMYVCDGSVVAANLGVNPSLTIAALSERAVSYIPAAMEQSWDDAARPGPEKRPVVEPEPVVLIEQPKAPAAKEPN